MDVKTEIRNAETSKAEIVHSEKMVGESVALSSNIDEKKVSPSSRSSLSA